MKVSGKVFLGALIGAVLGLAIYTIGYTIEYFTYTVFFFISCLWLFNPMDTSGFIWNREAFQTTMFFCVVICAALGGIWGGIAQMTEEERIKNSKILHSELNNFINYCNDLMNKTADIFSDLPYYSYEQHIMVVAEKCKNLIGVETNNIHQTLIMAQVMLDTHKSEISTFKKKQINYWLAHCWYWVKYQYDKLCKTVNESPEFKKYRELVSTGGRKNGHGQ